MGNPWMQGEGWRLRVDFGDWPGGGAGVGTFANGRPARRIREFRPGHCQLCLREGRHLLRRQTRHGEGVACKLSAPPLWQESFTVKGRSE